MLAVVTYLWRDPARDGRGYVCGPEHVKILKNMVERNLGIEHRFICVTDEKIDGIETVPMDWSKHVPGTVFARLMQHNPDWCRANLGERVLSFDVDIAITGNIDHIASRAEDIVLWRNPNFPAPKRAFYQSSVQLFSAGARPGLYHDFDPIEDGYLVPIQSEQQATAYSLLVKSGDGSVYGVGESWINWRFGGREQAWISEYLDWDEAHWTQEDGIYGAGRLFDGKTGEGVQTELPDNACIVSFPGARAPWQEEVQELHPWVKEHYQ